MTRKSIEIGEGKNIKNCKCPDCGQEFDLIEWKLIKVLGNVRGLCYSVYRCPKKECSGEIKIKA